MPKVKSAIVAKLRITQPFNTLPEALKISL